MITCACGLDLDVVAGMLREEFGSENYTLGKRLYDTGCTPAGIAHHGELFEKVGGHWRARLQKAPILVYKRRMP